MFIFWGIIHCINVYQFSTAPANALSTSLCRVCVHYYQCVSRDADIHSCTEIIEAVAATSQPVEMTSELAQFRPSLDKLLQVDGTADGAPGLRKVASVIGGCWGEEARSRPSARRALRRMSALNTYKWVGQRRARTHARTPARTHATITRMLTHSAAKACSSMSASGHASIAGIHAHTPGGTGPVAYAPYGICGLIRGSNGRWSKTHAGIK